MKQVFYWLVIRYLRILAKWQLRKNRQATVVGVTGSAGKTSMMMAIEAILKESFQVKVSEKANSEIGIPLNILGFKQGSFSRIELLRILPMAIVKLLFNWEKYDIYVVEMGIDSPKSPKNMSYLLSIIKPSVGVFINALTVHSEAFDYLPGSVVDQIAREKGKLISSLPENGVAVLNINDKRVMKFRNQTKAKVVSFDKINLQGWTLKVVDEHYGQIMAGAVAVAEVFGVDRAEAVKRLKRNFQLPPGRMTKIEGIKKTTLLDSSYNASRESMKSALAVLDKVGKKKRKIAVLGDLRELGKEAKVEHELVAEKAIKVADELVLVGPLMAKYFIPKALKFGFKSSQIHKFDNTYKALDFLKLSMIKGGEIVLIKASQNHFLFEIIVEGLMKDKSQARPLLCRQSRFWDKKRKLLQ
jgi:UDP-N-acetylmuramoyl-tripeptide--D-alanyl-D-alanine ligase